MAIIKGELIKKINDTPVQLYPTTSADNVVYDSNNTVEDKLNAIESALTAHAVTNKGSAFVSGLYKITVNAEGHITAATPVTKSDITGLGIPDAAATQSDDGLMSAADKAKLDGITSEKIQAWDAAEQNVNADWSQTDSTADDFIKNKPDFALSADVAAALAVKVDKETGKSLMTADEHTKLGGITIGTTQEFIDYIGVKR